MTAMALELEVAAAQVLADIGDVETAIDDAAGRDRSGGRAIDSAITESWARTTPAGSSCGVDPCRRTAR